MSFIREDENQDWEFAESGENPLAFLNFAPTEILVEGSFGKTIIWLRE